MVVEEGKMNSHGEVESRLQQEANRNHHSPFSSSSLGRQSSIYSLTLDEFQQSLLCESGKNFGSMNMDEFLSSIWSAEENQAIITSSNLPLSQTCLEKGTTTIRKQPSLPRQPSLSLPPPLCRKTVDEVWSQIQKEQQNNNSNDNNSVLNTEPAPRQPTFGEMTLEDFLVKAGVVREPCGPPPASHSQHQYQHQHQHHHQHYTNNNAAMPAMASSFVGRQVIGGGAVSNVVAPAYQVGEASGGYAGNGKRDSGGGYQTPAVCFGGGGYGVSMGMGAPVSPANSSDGIGNDGGQFGLDKGGLRGRKRMVDGPVEKVVERRQRRMIKNRESAARSRARKQAYTVELEAELNQLREENAQLKQALAEHERRKKQQCFEEVNVRVQTKAHKAKEKLRALRRNMSCPP
ncbi:ABSCISIC ACID-INSENSITIVE 5 [Spatholobus suberectus]|nr:ABSCISIC ACID-INSENSITIVE 5 [Spatholobus suberectus]